MFIRRKHDKYNKLLKLSSNPKTIMQINARKDSFNIIKWSGQAITIQKKHDYYLS